MALTPTKPAGDKHAGTSEAFLREVNDAVRSSDLQNFWKRYGRWLLGLLILGLAAFGGWIFYQNQQQKAADAVSEDYVKAMDDLNAGKEAQARVTLTALTKAKQPGYRAVSALALANIEAGKSDKRAATAAFAKIAKDASLPQPFRDLALMRQTMLEFDSLKPQAVVDRLKPLAVPGNPWFGTAGEMTALSYLKMGKDNLAGPIFAKIAQQEDLPPNLRSRAGQMAGALGIDAVQQNDTKKRSESDRNAQSKGEN